MSISKIEIENYKSIKRSTLSLENINLLIGENGTGKTNILDAVSYFYSSLLQDRDSTSAYRYQNRFCNEFTISITFDFGHLKKISGRNRQRGLRDIDSDYQGYYEWISRRQRWETLTLHKIKGKPGRWNKDWQYRQNILNLFPLYLVDARQVNLTDWGQLWEIIGDLMKVHRSKEVEIAGEISALKDKEDYKLEERFRRLTDSFSKANVQIQQFTPKQYASVISTLLFKGNVFEFKGSRLDYMSNGTNAFNYTNLLIEILKLISDYKMKDPVMILDEPEISLHHKLVDQLTARIFGCNGAIRFLIASHSPRLLKNVLKTERSNCQVFHVSSYNEFTRASAVTLFSQEMDPRLRVVMTDQHANAYFSRYILSVEGATEVEVFSNAYLLELFPFLKNVDVMEGMSNDVQQRIISPKRRNFRTPILLLIDMDKAVNYKGNNSFRLESKYFPKGQTCPENYDYSPKRTKQHLRRKRIYAMADQCRFKNWYPFFSSKDPNFKQFIALVKSYLLEKNIYVMATTIEGALINESNLNDFWYYFSLKNQSKKSFLDLSQAYHDFLPNDRLNFMRLLHCGKSDYILTLKGIKENNPKIDPDLYQLIEKNCSHKTDGWVTQWLDYSLCKAASLQPDGKTAFTQFCKRLEDTQFRSVVRWEFSYQFPELYGVIERIREQMQTS